MKKTNIRKTMIAVLAAAMCTTGAVIPTSADNVSVCKNNDHIWIHASHGSIVDNGQPETYCRNISYYQCLYTCKHQTCTATLMQNHYDVQAHAPGYQSSPSGVIRVCMLCGYLFD